MGRTFYEASFQIVLQGSAVMAAGHGVFSQPLLLGSLVLSAVVGLPKLLAMTQPFASGLVCIVPYSLFGGFLFIWGAGRVVMAETCESKMWGMSTGCIEMPW